MGVNGILLLDKSEGWTSQDAVAKLRGILHEKRIGHAGTLDPLATGLLVVLVGRATRAASYAEAEEKEYVAALRLGVTTDTQDITGTVLRTSEQIPGEAGLLAVLPRFTGELEQLPPMYSAIKVKGQKLYDIARRGGSVERTPRRITVHSLEYLGKTGEDFLLRIRCSKGTYIRTLCHDIGEALGCGGCMASLRRTRIGAFSVEDARTISEITEADRETLLPIDCLFPAAQPLVLTEGQEKRCRCGNPFAADVPDGEYRFYGADGTFLAYGSVLSGGAVTIKSFFEV